MRRLGKLEVIAFVTGFSLMAFELAAARILAPTIGSSTYVWTSVIGVIIAALSVGYYAGGIVADKRNLAADVAWMLLCSAATVTLTLLIYEDLLDSAMHWQVDVRLQAVIVATALFAPTSFVLGMISPYLAKLNVRSLSASGRSVASLSALNSIGGIAGTFVTGFILFSYIGSRETIVLVALMLLVASWVIVPEYRRRLRIGLTAAVLVIIFFSDSSVEDSYSFALETPSAHYEVQEFVYDGLRVRGIRTGPGSIQSGVDMSGSSTPVFWYTQQLAQLTLDEQPQRVLVLGGGAFTLPEYLGEQLPEATIDVVEIDPDLAPIARNFFYYDDPSNVNLIFDDARAYINQTDKRYDVIIVDVYGDTSIPFSLMTREYGEAIAAHLQDDGVVLANIVGGTVGECRGVFDALSSTYLNEFKYGRYSTQQPSRELRRGNIIGVYTNRDDVDYGVPIKRINKTVYTDNFTPSERLYYQCLAATT